MEIVPGKHEAQCLKPGIGPRRVGTVTLKPTGDPPPPKLIALTSSRRAGPSLSWFWVPVSFRSPPGELRRLPPTARAHAVAPAGNTDPPLLSLWSGLCKRRESEPLLGAPAVPCALHQAPVLSVVTMPCLPVSVRDQGAHSRGLARSRCSRRNHPAAQLTLGDISGPPPAEPSG